VASDDTRHCNELQHALQYKLQLILQHTRGTATALHVTAADTAAKCTILQHTATHRDILQRTLKHTLQYTLQHTRGTAIMELPAKLLNYFSRSNKSNINQIDLHFATSDNARHYNTPEHTLQHTLQQTLGTATALHVASAEGRDKVVEHLLASKASAKCIAVCCSVLKGVLQCVAVLCDVLPYVARYNRTNDVSDV